MNAHTFQECTQLAENFHGYAAPGLLIGGCMVEMAKARMTVMCAAAVRACRKAF